MLPEKCLRVDNPLLTYVILKRNLVKTNENDINIFFSQQNIEVTPIVFFTIPESKTYLGLVALEVGELFLFFRQFLVNFLGFRDITYPRFSIFCSIKYFMLQIDLSCEISQNFILLVQTLRFCRSRIARGNSKSLLGYNFNKSRAFSICFQHTIT